MAGKWLFVLLLATPASLQAFRSCGSATCPLNTFRSSQQGTLTLGLTHEYINQDQLYLGSGKSFVGAVPELHDEVRTLNERNDILLQLGITDALGASADLPFIHREHSHISHETGSDTWESWNFSGMGDMKLSASYAILRGVHDSLPTLTLIGGVKVPTGVTGLKNGSGEEAEVTIQPGTGSTDGFVALDLRHTLATVPTIDGNYGSLPLSAGISYQFNGAGTDGYRFGNIVLAHLGTGYQVAKGGSILLQVNGKFQEYADVGQTAEPRENTGGTWIFASPGLNLRLNDELDLTAYAQFPLYQNVHGLQQTAPFNLSFNLSYTLNLLSDR